MNILVRAPVEGDALGLAKTEHLVNMIVAGRVAMGGGWGREAHIEGGGGLGDVGPETRKGNNNRNVNKKYSS